MTGGSEFFLRVTRDHRLAEEWELVLLAQGLSPRLRRTRDGVVLSVPEDEAERAIAGLSAYERENPPKLEEGEEAAGFEGLRGGVVVAAMLLGFFVATIVWNSTVPWIERGSADASRILQGELWRTVTALTLHADFVHVLTNAIGTALFLGGVSGMVGLGLGSALVLLAGVGGNLANAILHGSAHVSIGASTSVFGAVAMLGGLGMARRRRRAVRSRRAWVPVAAALALLGMLGTGGGRVDIWAHLFGFLFGGILGILITFITPRRPGLPIQWACGGAALAVLVSCWLLALG